MFTYYVSQIWGFLGSSPPPCQQLANSLPLRRLTLYMNSPLLIQLSIVHLLSIGKECGFCIRRLELYNRSPSNRLHGLPRGWAGFAHWLDTGQCLFRSAANHCFRIRQHVDLKGSKLIFEFFVFVYFSLWSNASNFTSLQGRSVFRNVSDWLTQWLTLSPIEMSSDSCLDR